MSRQDRQHYVPQSLLKNFALDTSKRQAYVIKIDLVRLRIENKESIHHTKEICAESIKKLCSELNYLSTNFKNFDKEFDIVDNQTPPVIKKIWGCCRCIDRVILAKIVISINQAKVNNAFSS